MFPITCTPIGSVESRLLPVRRGLPRLEPPAGGGADRPGRRAPRLRPPAGAGALPALSALEQLGIAEERWHEVRLGGLESVTAEPGPGRDPIEEGEA